MTNSRGSGYYTSLPRKTGKTSGWITLHNTFTPLTPIQYSEKDMLSAYMSEETARELGRIRSKHKDSFYGVLDDDAPYYVRIMAVYYELLYYDRPYQLTREEFVQMRLNPKNRFPWAIEPRKDWELRSLIYLKNRMEDRKRIQALKKIFSELEGEFE